MKKIFLLILSLFAFASLSFADPDLGEPERPGSAPDPVPVERPTRPAPTPVPAPAPAPIPGNFTGNPEVDMPPVACRFVPNRPYRYSCRVMANWHTTHWDEDYMIERNRKCKKIRQGMYYCSLDFEGFVYNGN